MRYLLSALFLLALTAPSYAGKDLDNIGALTQNNFRLLSEDLGSAMSYKAIAPAEPLGTIGVDIGVELTATRMQNSEAWDQASSGGGLSTALGSKVHIHKGLPANIDVGAFLATVPNTNVNAMGAELRYAFIEGGIASPAVAVRAAYTQVSGVDQLDFDTTSLELTASKGFINLTPYGGAGVVWTNSTPKGIAGLGAEKFSLNKFYAGVNINFALFNLAFEADKTGDALSYSAKFGFRL